MEELVAQTLILWEVDTPYNNKIQVQAESADEAKTKAQAWIMNTPASNYEGALNVKVSVKPKVIHAVIL